MKTISGEWWDYSWNVAPGCTKVGPECAHCWALAMAARLQGMKKPGYEGLAASIVGPPAHPPAPGRSIPYGYDVLRPYRRDSPNAGLDTAKNAYSTTAFRGTRWTGRVNLLEARLEEPLRLKRPRRIAVNLMGDLFHDQVPIEFIGRVFGIMSLAPRHTFMVLTKRPERMVECIRSIWAFAGILRNVWLGTTAGTQRSANERWSAMAWLAQAGWKTWVSSEPRLEAIDWHGWEFLKALATGGESGPYARPMSPAWLRADREWCGAHGVKFWFKQWGEWAPVPSPYPPALSPSGRAPDGEREPGGLENYPMTTLGGEMLFRFGRKMAGRELDGRTWEEWPDFTTKDMKEHEGEL